MAQRKSSDGSAGGESPGSYVKVSGSRRKRKRRNSTLPPPEPQSVLAESRVVDTVGEDEGRTSERDNSVDDLRRGSKPSSARPRNELGPLGMEDIRAEPPANTVTVGSDRPRVLKVIEINASESPRHDPFGDEITTESPVSSLFGEEEEDELPPRISAEDLELARQYQLDERISKEVVEESAIIVAAAEPEDSWLPPRQALARREEPSRHDEPSRRDELARREELEAQQARNSLSSVLGARPSLRPTPYPETARRDSASWLWWAVVAALIAIIAAAGAIAAREQFASKRTSAPVAQPEPPPVQEAPAPAVVPPPVSFGTPQWAEPTPAAEVKAVQPGKSEPTKAPSVRPSVVPVARAAAKPIAPKPAAPKPAAKVVYQPPPSEPVAPVAPVEAVKAPEPAPETKPAAEPAPEVKRVTPAAPDQLPVNPY